MKKLSFLLLFCFVPIIQAQEGSRFMVVGDTHHSSPSPNFEETLLNEIALAAIDEQVEFIFFTGDLVIRGFSDPANEDSVLKDWRFVLDTLAQHEIKVYACRGNNDFSKTAWDSLFKGNHAFPQNGPENEINITYALEFNNILFLSLDQYTVSHRINQTWLDSVLRLNQKTHIFAAGHEPAFKLLHSGCMGAYPAERDSMWESLTAAGAKIFFSGHDHFYDHAIIDDGDENPNNDIHQVIVGTGNYMHRGGEFNGNNGRWTPIPLFHEETNGYVLIEVMDDDVQMTWKHRIEAGVFEDGGDSYIFTPTGIGKEAVSVHDFVLHQNYPNPFNSKTVISYQLPVTSHVDLSIYNILGQKVANLIAEKEQAGIHRVEWDATEFASGVYFYQMNTDQGHTEIKKLLLLK